VRDRADQLDRCLAALHPLRVVVVDDASHDPSAVADSLVALTETLDDGVDLPALVVGRRLDDAAYGLGLWLGALRGRSLAALTPRRPGQG
jgi:hypothetical protein